MTLRIDFFLVSSIFIPVILKYQNLDATWCLQGLTQDQSWRIVDVWNDKQDDIENLLKKSLLFLSVVVKLHSCEGHRSHFHAIMDANGCQT